MPAPLTHGRPNSPSAFSIRHMHGTVCTNIACMPTRMQPMHVLFVDSNENTKIYPLLLHLTCCMLRSTPRCMRAAWGFPCWPVMQCHALHATAMHWPGVSGPARLPLLVCQPALPGLGRPQNWLRALHAAFFGGTMGQQERIPSLHRELTLSRKTRCASSA